MPKLGFCLLLLTSVILNGCGPNGFLKHYVGTKYEPLPNSEPVSVVFPSTPEGSKLIGTSDFVSCNGEKDREAISAARKVGANYVAWNADYLDTSTTSGVMPITTPTTTTTYHSGSVWGNGGSASYSGYSTTHGSKTTYIPYTKTRHWYKYTAKFYRIIDQP